MMGIDYNKAKFDMKEMENKFVELSNLIFENADSTDSDVMEVCCFGDKEELLNCISDARSAITGIIGYLMRMNGDKHLKLTRIWPHV